MKPATHLCALSRRASRLAGYRMIRLLFARRSPVGRLWLCLITLVAGCRSHGGVLEQAPITAPPIAREIETPTHCDPPAQVALSATVPFTVDTQQEPTEWFLTLDEVVQITLANSDVIRDLGGRVVGAPQGLTTVYDPALQEINPNTGVEAALSAFDAQLTNTLIFDRDERSFNNFFAGAGTRSLHSNTTNYTLELAKRGAAGTRYAVRNLTLRDSNSSPANAFPSVYQTTMEAEVRHPLGRGGGIDFNRIAGPNGLPGNYNGVVLARIRTDIVLADFEAAVRNLVREVEIAYWRLYFAYRTLDARKAAYEAALSSWRTVQDQLDAGTSDAEREALARANFYQIKASVQNALSGGSQTSGIGIVGVYSTERNLRLLMGVPAADGRLIRPADDPSFAKRIFDWPESLELALSRRVELRRQRWTVKQRENELIAARNLLLSRIDLVGLYRWRGFGDNLFGSRNIPNGSAFEDLWQGDLQGWRLGVEYSATLGKRQEHAAVRAAELQLARDRAILRNQELAISTELSSQFGEMERAFAVTQDNFNRAIAERQRLEKALAKYDAGAEILEFVLQAQQNTAIADSDFYDNLVAYNIAVGGMHVARGTYLNYMGVRLSEGPWSPDAYRSYQKEFRRFEPRLDYCMMRPLAISSGPHSQEVDNYQAAEALPPSAEQDASPAPTMEESPPPMAEKLPLEMGTPLPTQ